MSTTTILMMTMTHLTSTTTFHQSLSAAGTLVVLLAAVMSTLVSQLSTVVSAECVECQILLSQHGAAPSPGITHHHHP